MRTNRIIASVMAAALTITAIPSYTADRTVPVMPAYAADTENYIGQYTIDGLTYNCYTNHAELHGGKDVSGEVIIPDSIELPKWAIAPLTVTVIGLYAFSGNTAITKVVIPDTVETIDYHAFEDCTSLEEVVIPEGITDIYGGILYNTPAGEKLFGGTDAMIINGTLVALRDNKNKKLIEVPAGAVRLAKHFDTGSQSIVFPEGFEYISSSSFSDNISDEIKQIFLPSTLKEIDSCAFSLRNCRIYYAGSEEEWKKIRIEEFGNEDLYDEGAVMFGVTYPLEAETGLFTVSKHSTDLTIEKCSADAEGKVVIGLGEDYSDCMITAVADGAFSGCDKITGITIPRTVWSVGKEQFDGCTALTDIWYEGSENDWNRMFSRPDIPEEVTLHFDDKRKTSLFINVNDDGYVEDRGCSGDIYIGSEAKLIDFDTFEDNNNITSVTIEEGVECIYSTAFMNCSNLKELFIPLSVREGGIVDPKYCPALTDVWYAGTTDDWNRMDSKPFLPDGVTLHCKDAVTGEYITAGNIRVDTEILYGSTPEGIRLSVHEDSDNPRVVYKWVTGIWDDEIIAVPMNNGKTTYSISIDDTRDRFVYTEPASGISFSEGNTAYSQTIVLDRESEYYLDDLIEDHIVLKTGSSLITYVTGKNAELKVSNDVMSYMLIRKESDKAYYIITAENAGKCTFTVSSDDRAEDEKMVINVSSPEPQIPEPTYAYDSHSPFAKFINEPDGRLAEGDSTEMMVYGYDYSPDIRIYDPEGGCTIDNKGEFIELRKIEQSGSYAKYRLTAKKACVSELCLNMVEPWDFFAPRVSITVGDVAVSAPAADNTAGNVVKGDANSDGKVNVSDSVTVLQYISNQKKYPMTEAEIALADIDGEKGITGGDAIAIQKMDAGII